MTRVEFISIGFGILLWDCERLSTIVETVFIVESRS